MERRKLPIGIQTFREIREEGFYYVDKTDLLVRLIDEGKHYFLSRPRRFGKSLLLDTLKELFECNEPLFRGLAIHERCRWDWTKPHPVVRLDFGKGNFKEPGYVHANVMAQFDAVQRATGVISDYATAPERFAHLLEALHEKAGERVVVLVDEYDKPILDALGESETATANRDYLRGLYSTIKFSDAHVRFTLLTGVSKFSKVSLFSDLNNLLDITLDPPFATICGYTERDLDTVFAPELDGFDRKEIRRWYNGYHWLGEEKAYNPFDVLQLFRRREFANYWFETGTPRFLVDTLAERGVRSVDLDGMLATSTLLSAFDVDEIATEALLFQTGYLTILDRTPMPGQTRYRLAYPNQEVRQSLNESLLNRLTGNPSRNQTDATRLHDLLLSGDTASLEAVIRSLFSAIPYEWHTRNEIARYEGYYASVLYSHFAALGLDVTVEDSTSHGRVDMAVQTDERVYLVEFKVQEAAGEGAAMAQLVERDYAAKYRHLGQPIHLVAVEFSRESRNVATFEVASA